MPRPLIRAFGLLKKVSQSPIFPHSSLSHHLIISSRFPSHPGFHLIQAAAKANGDLKQIPDDVSGLIQRACDEVTLLPLPPADTRPAPLHIRPHSPFSPTPCCHPRRHKVIEGKLDDHFPLRIWQTGSGTQTNMNTNEVVANRAIQLAGATPGRPATSSKPLHCSSAVSLSSTSDVLYPLFPRRRTGEQNARPPQ